MEYDWVPYATGLVVAVAGAVLQSVYIWRLGEELRPVRQRLELSGDLAQLICTMVSVLPAAIALVTGKLLLFTVTISIAVCLVGVCCVAMSIDRIAPFYCSWRVLRIFMPASWVAITLCSVGLVVALVAQSGNQGARS